MTIPAHGTAPVPSGAFDRLVHWVLDVNGDIYGDERERLRWYEAIALAASFQWLAVPWALAVTVWFVPQEAVWALLVVLAAFWFPMLLVSAYVHRRQVRPVSYRGRKALLVGLLSGLPYLVLVAGLVTDGGSRTDVGVAPLVGGAVGCTIAVVALRVLERRRRRRAAEDGE